MVCKIIPSVDEENKNCVKAKMFIMVSNWQIIRVRLKMIFFLISEFVTILKP